MKYLFFLLLLGNIVLYLWETGHRQPREEVNRIQLQLPDSHEEIKLLKEAPAAPKKSPGATPAKEAPPAATIKPEPPPVAVEPAPVKVEIDPHCRLIGPYADADAARASLDQLQSRLEGLELVSRTEASAEGFWVLYPRAENIYAARANRKMLSDRGIRDLWLFDKGELENAISLGVFKTRDRAEAMQEELRAKGIEVEIKPRMARTESNWLRLSWRAGNGELQELLGSDAHLAVRNCEN